MECVSCSLLLDRLSLLERRVCELEQLDQHRQGLVTLDVSGFPDSIRCRSDSSPASDSSSCGSAAPAVVAEGAMFVPVRRRGRAGRGKPPVVRSCPRSPPPTANRFSALSSPLVCADRRPVSSAPADRSEHRTLVIGDSVTRNVRLETPAIVHCLPGARASDIEANLRVLTSHRKGEFPQTHTRTTYKQIVIHVGTNNVRMRQSEVTKDSLARTLELGNKMSRHRLIVSGPLPVRGSDEQYSRLVSMNRWLARHCSQKGYGFVDNWPSFWGRPGLLRADGRHPTGHGAAILSSNIDRCIRCI